MNERGFIFEGPEQWELLHVTSSLLFNQNPWWLEFLYLAAWISCSPLTSDANTYAGHTGGYEIDQQMQIFPNRCVEGSNGYTVATHGFTNTSKGCYDTFQWLLTEYRQMSYSWLMSSQC